MDPNRKLWNQRQQALRRALGRTGDRAQAIDLFFSQHAMVHTARLGGGQDWSFADEVWLGLDEPALRRVPPGGEHSIAWLIWHIARIEDVTLSRLAAGRPELWAEADWSAKLKVAARDTGNAMDAAGVAALSAAVNLKALWAYRLAVGRRTRQIVPRLTPAQLRQKVDPVCLQQLLAEGVVVEAATAVLDYWGRLTVGQLLLMPPTRHNIIHLNEALRIRLKRA